MTKPPHAKKWGRLTAATISLVSVDIIYCCIEKTLFSKSIFDSLFAPAFAQTCINVNDCSGSSYAVKKDFSLPNPTVAPTNAQGPTVFGSCSSAETYQMYVA